MTDFSVEDIIHHSQKIEQESFAFYKSAEEKLKNKSLITLVQELAEAEIDHFNKLKSMLSEEKLSAKDLEATVSLEEASLDMIVEVRNIPENAEAGEILSIALEREQKTKNLYQRLLAFTNISEDLSSTFEYLVNQEAGHVIKIENKMKKESL
jgi:rubrerythrin